jgi:hypothetical protein
LHGGTEIGKRTKGKEKETKKDFICLGCRDELNHQIAREESPEVAVLTWLYITVSAFFIGYIVYTIAL